MAAGLVIGIFPESDAKALETALSAQQVDVTKVKVLASDGRDTGPTKLQFIDVIAEVEYETGDDMTEGTGVMQDFGTGVPGLTDHGETYCDFSHHGDTTAHYLTGFPVPDDEVDNFDEAIAEGRAVVLYPDAGSDAPKLAAAFKAAGLHNVRSY